MHPAYRVRFTVYVVRHAVGVALFAAITIFALVKGETLFGGIVGGLGAIYGAFAAATSVKLFRMGQRHAAVSRAQAAQGSGTSAPK